MTSALVRLRTSRVLPLTIRQQRTQTFSTPSHGPNSAGTISPNSSQGAKPSELWVLPHRHSQKSSDVSRMYCGTRPEPASRRSVQSSCSDSGWPAAEGELIELRRARGVLQGFLVAGKPTNTLTEPRLRFSSQSRATRSEQRIATGHMSQTCAVICPGRGGMTASTSGPTTAMIGMGARGLKAAW